MFWQVVFELFSFFRRLKVQRRLKRLTSDRKERLMPKLTKHFIDTEIEYPSKGYRIYRDDELPGFAVRVTKRKCFDGIKRYN